MPFGTQIIGGVTDRDLGRATLAGVQNRDRGELVASPTVVLVGDRKHPGP